MRGRLWRATNPNLVDDERQGLVRELMAARRAVRDAKGEESRVKSARSRVHSAKVALGERGPAWWEDGARDYNRYMVENTPYADWWASIGSTGGA